jgi:nucleotide-binding universal stress UspA family protein
MIKRILVPHDFSDLGARAFRVAAELASQCKAELVLFHVTDLAGELSPDALITPDGESRPITVAQYTARGAKKRLQDIADASGARNARCEVDFGDVGDQILAAIERYQVDAVVMGTHGRTGLSHVLLGSVAEYVLRRATVPVVTCRGHGGPARLTPEEEAAQDELAG